LLALRWIVRSDELLGVDAFVSLCVAFETLAPHPSGSITPFKNAIDRIYGVPESEKGDRFHVGRIAGLRATIVHKGGLPGVDRDADVVRLAESTSTATSAPCPRS
jgi:hypothetical protein